MQIFALAWGFNIQISLHTYKFLLRPGGFSIGTCTLLAQLQGSTKLAFSQFSDAV